MKKKAPYKSQIKYRQNNPAVAFRLKKEDKTILDGLIKASGKPLSKWMTDFLHNKTNQEIKRLEDAVKGRDSRILALERKIKELNSVERFSVPCPKCYTPMYFSNQDTNWITEIEPRLKRAFYSYTHWPECPE